MSATPLATAPAETTARTPTGTDAERALAPLIAAFAGDPIVRWFFPDAGSYLTTFPEVLRLASGGTTPAARVDLLDGATAAAIWHEPGTATADEQLGALVSARVPTARHRTVFEFLEQMETHHPDPATVWYLPFIGVDPTRQGEGHGSALVRTGLERAERDGVPAYLEASSVRNRALYERHGFEVTGEIQVGDSPPLWPMLWQPR